MMGHWVLDVDLREIRLVVQYELLMYGTHKR